MSGNPPKRVIRVRLRSGSTATTPSLSPAPSSASSSLNVTPVPASLPVGPPPPSGSSGKGTVRIKLGGSTPRGHLSSVMAQLTERHRRQRSRQSLNESVASSIDDIADDVELHVPESPAMSPLGPPPAPPSDSDDDAVTMPAPALPVPTMPPLPLPHRRQKSAMDLDGSAMHMSLAMQAAAAARFRRTSENEEADDTVVIGQSSPEVEERDEYDEADLSLDVSEDSFVPPPPPDDDGFSDAVLDEMADNFDTHFGQQIETVAGADHKQHASLADLDPFASPQSSPVPPPPPQRPSQERESRMAASKLTEQQTKQEAGVESEGGRTESLVVDAAEFEREMAEIQQQRHARRQVFFTPGASPTDMPSLDMRIDRHGDEDDDFLSDLVDDTEDALARFDEEDGGNNGRSKGYRDLVPMFDSCTQQVSNGLSRLERLYKFTRKFASLAQQFSEKCSVIVLNERRKMAEIPRDGAMRAHGAHECFISYVDTFAQLVGEVAARCEAGTAQPESFRESARVPLKELLLREKSARARQQQAKSVMLSERDRTIKAADSVLMVREQMAGGTPSTSGEHKRETSRFSKFMRKQKAKAIAQGNNTEAALAELTQKAVQQNQLYEASIENFNAQKTALVNSDLPVILDDLQQLERDRLTVQFQCLEGLQHALRRATEPLGTLNERLATAVSETDADKDIANFVNARLDRCGGLSEPLTADLPPRCYDVLGRPSVFHSLELCKKLEMENGITSDPDEVPRLVTTLTEAVTTLGAGLRTEGIFRVSAQEEELRALKKQFDAGKDYSVPGQSPHLPAALLKLWLRGTR
ncbi:MAG: hypothetical protein MHM6MM_005142 [Cercozoa sp. M6MM]